MTQNIGRKTIRQVFRDVQKHRQIEQLIRRFSSNRDDIRLTALNKVDLSECRNVLELGSAFGAFTEALKGRLHPAARITGLDIIPEYGPFFLDACSRAGYSGRFSSVGVRQIKRKRTAHFDLVVCSFALYFFADIIPEIARVLTKDGIFITITHSHCNMQELIAVTKTILLKNGLLAKRELLPVEIILSHFSAENGKRLLAPYFQLVRQIKFKNTLIFQPDDIRFLLEYYQFKEPFFLTGTHTGKKDIVDDLLAELKKLAAKDGTVTMCKDDGIFICSQSRMKEKS
jgi:ubiquinone/menaquinone biosynthesis C-methylase UbiE